jgi:hypothetical protein
MTLTSDARIKKVGWIAAAVVGGLTLVSAVWLALEAQSRDPLPEIHAKKPDYLKSRSRRRAKGSVRRAPARPVRPRGAGGALETIRDRRRERSEKRDNIKRAVKRPPLPRVKSVKRHRGTRRGYRPGRLSPEELRKRREERRARQIDRLRNRIKTLGDRIETYREDGTRTEAQIERMERSLERMRKRLGRMEEQQREREDER